MSDLIERQAAIDAANRADYTGLAVEDVKKVTDEVVKELKQLPSAQPERKTGEWISCKTQLPPTMMICHCTIQEDRLIGTSMRDRYTMDLIYDDILNEWKRLSGMKISSSIRVVAWMKAAEPYGGE